jgi:hypothetical protein
VPAREQPGSDPVPDAGRELQEPKRVRHGRPVLAHPVGDLFVRETELVLEARIGFGRVERVQVLTLDVLDERHLEKVALGLLLPPDDRDLRQARQRGRPPPPLPGDDLELFAPGGHDDRLDDALLPDGRGELRERALRELAAGLEPVGNEPADLDLPCSPAACFTWNIVPPGQERRKTPPQRLFLSHRIPLLFNSSRPRAR